MLFYIVFGTNLLTEGPVPVSVFLPILDFCRKRIPNGVQTELNLRDDPSWTESKPEDLEMKSGTQRGGHEAGERAQGVGRAPYLVAPSWVSWPSSFAYIYSYTPKNIRGSHETTFPPPQPSVPVISHLGAFFGAPPEGASITEGFYINTIASLMMCE